MSVVPVFSRIALRRLKLGLETVLGIRKQGFFIPYRYAGTIEPADEARPAYSRLEKTFLGAEPDFRELLDAMAGLCGDLDAIGEDGPPEPRWRQDWFPGLDAAAAYAMVRTRKPSRILEIGSGHSTRFLARAVRDGGLNTQITAIDPAPRADLSRLQGINLILSVVQDADPAIFATLRPGDILSIDSSHILMPGTDVDMFLSEVVPGLPAGVLLHIHDIFLPWPYPAAWEWRGYNEQQGVAALIGSGGWTLLWSSAYARRRLLPGMPDHPAKALPVPSGAHESSLWIEKKAPA
ncbi:class I SAM-dependent methyltransferase [Hwanghaeella grinnelliae]|uniref:Class I SAM-dependent methyltransferase n=1 Tax=Hwanghaeella grinnelliae TaxID=2500179 RepID=A0A3S2Z8N4_9PROT|nr:class I SAM-dependent methyltransferase [Hwanghaeella grinnelliae]RVU36258.1 class I SAM-dependent methyltransferase [Hwanghaeella grinnelliae]